MLCFQVVVPAAPTPACLSVTGGLFPGCTCWVVTDECRAWLWQVERAGREPGGIGGRGQFGQKSGSAQRHSRHATQAGSGTPLDWLQSQEPEPGTNNLTGTLRRPGQGQKKRPAGYEIEIECPAAGPARLQRRCTPSIPYRPQSLPSCPSLEPVCRVFPSPRISRDIRCCGFWNDGRPLEASGSRSPLSPIANPQHELALKNLPVWAGKTHLWACLPSDPTTGRPWPFGSGQFPRWVERDASDVDREQGPRLPVTRFSGWLGR